MKPTPLYLSKPTYRVLSHIPGVKSWGWLPEHEDLTLSEARAVRKRFRQHKMHSRIVETRERFVH